MPSILSIFDRKDTNRIVDIPTEKIVPSRYQPRLVFDEEALRELALSIKENGLIQPITVRKMCHVISCHRMKTKQHRWHWLKISNVKT